MMLRDQKNDTSVEITPDFQALLAKHPVAAAQWGSLSPSHKREYWQYITEAKKPETRERRMQKSIEMLEAEPKGTK